MTRLTIHLSDQLLGYVKRLAARDGETMEQKAVELLEKGMETKEE